MTGRRAPLGSPLRRTLGIVGLFLILVASPVALAGSLSSPAAGHALPITAVTPSTSHAVLPPASTLGPHEFPPVQPSIRGQPICTVTDPVVPNCAYTAEAAPMGIGDFGVSGSGAYAYNTTQFLGTFAYSELDINNVSGGVGDSFTVQLNIILNFIDSGTNYSYWIQDVAVPTDSSQNKVAMSYEDNIWNFSGSFAIPTTTLSGNGTIASAGAGEDYYSDGAGGPGSGDQLNAPNSFQLLDRAYQTAAGLPVVTFEYKDPTMTGFQTYDTVTFNFAKHVSLDRGFFVDGHTFNAGGLFNDAELTIGGPGGGSYTVTQSVTNVQMELYYWNGHNYQSTPSAWNFGSDTAESTSNDQSIFSNDGSGTPLTANLNGTVKDATPGPAYAKTQVGGLDITAAGDATGTVAVHAKDWSFWGGQANLTLTPGTYHVWVNGTSSVNLGMCTIVAGVVASVILPATCATTINSFTANPNPGVQGTLSTFITAVGGAGPSPYSYTYTGLPPGCATADLASLPCTPTATGTYTVTVAVTNATGGTPVTDSLTFVVDTPPPAITGLGATPNPVNEGSSTTISETVTGGTPPYTITYTGLPTGCASANTSTLACTPQASGKFEITVSVADSASGHIHASFNLTVDVPPLVITSFTATPPTFVLGSTSALAVTASGSGTLTYAYSAPAAAGCLTAVTVNTTSCTPTASGDFNVSVTVTDTALDHYTDSVMLTVTLPPAPTVTSFTVSPAEVLVGATVTLTVLTSGGLLPLTYAYVGLPTGCANDSVATLTCVPSAAGAYSIHVVVRDGAGRTVDTQSVSVQVWGVLAIASFTATPATANIGQAVSFSLATQGGDSPLTYSYTNLPPGCSNPGSVTSFTCADPTTGGTYVVTVTVSDSFGQTTTGKATVTIVGPSSSTTVLPFGLSLTDFILFVIILVAVIAIVAAALARRRSSHEAPPEGPAWGAPPGGGVFVPCPACGSGVAPGVPFCTECGAKVQ